MDVLPLPAPAEDLRSRAAALPRSIWRRRGDASLSTLSGGIRLAVFTSPFIVRWAAWSVALLILLITNVPRENHVFEPYLLIGTFVQTAVVTFYVPVIRPLLLPSLQRRVATAENADVLALGVLQGGRALDDALPRVVTSAVDSSRLDAVAIFVPDDAGEVRAYGLQDTSGREASAKDVTARLEPADLSEAFGDEGVRTVAR